VIIGLAGTTVAAIAPVATPYVFILATVGPCSPGSPSETAPTWHHALVHTVFDGHVNRS
jgi:hypothetical protein